MLQITDEDIAGRIRVENPWWDRADAIPFSDLPNRAPFEAFVKAIRPLEVNRAIILMGPRRVGKTVLIHQAISWLIGREDIDPAEILYISIDAPTYSACPLERLLDIALRLGRPGTTDRPFRYVFFDEIQYLADWENHLKVMVDDQAKLPVARRCRFTVSGSAAAALRRQSRESGAGRFTDFVLPPLAFCEYLRFLGVEDELIDQETTEVRDIGELNRRFFDYLNFGGFPETVYQGLKGETAQAMVRGDILDKVLLRDLPSLYGIGDVRELNRLFSVLAFNTGLEISLNELSKASQVAANTIRRYLDYLEAAFLISRLERIDQNAKRFQRATHFKVYLTNPSMRAALFGAIDPDDEKAGPMVETAIASQIMHDGAVWAAHAYARWAGGEVDFVRMDQRNQIPEEVLEIKWSDLAAKDVNHKSLKSLLSFTIKHKMNIAWITSRTKWSVQYAGNLKVVSNPCAVECYTLGKVLVEPWAGRRLYDRHPSDN